MAIKVFLQREGLIALAALVLASPAMAYIGPGAGVSFLGSFFSAIMVILLVIGTVLFWPLRYLWRRLKRLAREAQEAKQVRQTQLESDLQVNQDSK